MSDVLFGTLKMDTPRPYPPETYGTGDVLTRRDIDASRNRMDSLTGGALIEFAWQKRGSLYIVAAFISDGAPREIATCLDDKTASDLAATLNNARALLQRVRVPLGPPEATRPESNDV